MSISTTLELFRGSRGCWVVAAHRLTAHKTLCWDDYALLRGSFGEVAEDFGIEMILDRKAP